MTETAAMWASAAMAAGSTVASTVSASKQRRAASRAAREQQRQIAQATAEAKAEKTRIDNIEKERLERLRKKGAGLPPSLLTGMSGVQAPATTIGPVLGA